MRIYLLALLGTVTAGDGFTATCHNNNTMTVNIPFSRTAEVLELSYGICGKNSSGVENIAQDPSDFSFNIKLSMVPCGMDSTLRSIEYLQEAVIRIGIMSVDISTGEDKELNLAEFFVDSYCEVDDTYEVVFNYGTLKIVKDNFTESAGGVNISFVIRAYDSAFDNAGFGHSTTAGEMIYLGLTIADDQEFDWMSKEFAPESCRVHDTINSFQYTLFDATKSGGCQNADIDLIVDYDPVTYVWQFTHIIFLLADTDESTYELICVVKVCDISQMSDCDAIRTECNITLASADAPEVALEIRVEKDSHIVIEYSADLEGAADAVAQEGGIQTVLEAQLRAALGDNFVNFTMDTGNEIASNSKYISIEYTFDLGRTYPMAKRRRRGGGYYISQNDIQSFNDDFANLTSLAFTHVDDIFQNVAVQQAVMKGVYTLIMEKHALIFGLTAVSSATAYDHFSMAFGLGSMNGSYSLECDNQSIPYCTCTSEPSTFPSAFICDGGNDCFGGEDEAFCLDFNGCQKGMKSCEDINYPRECFDPVGNTCDGYDNCLNGFDESQCGQP